MDVIFVYLICGSIGMYGGYRFSHYAIKRWLVGWKLIIVNPQGKGREWYFKK